MTAPPDSGWPFGVLERGKYAVILADPPWHFQTRSDKGTGRSPLRYYDTMDLAAIKALPVAALAARDCVLFLWSTNPMRAMAFDVIAAWGFTYKTVAFTWVKRTTHGKQHFGNGSWTRQNTEQCLLATRGSPKRSATLDGRRVREVIESVKREHSRKPDEQYLRIERLVAGPYVELFARHRRPRWSAWGAQLPELRAAA